MTTFVQQAACKGHRPSAVVPRRHQSRGALVAQLLRDREVPRFLVAPTGYGKTMLAYEYAEVVFGFSHVFWVNGQSPCFLRDVDEGSFAEALLAVDEHCALVVFEDLPLLLDERAERFSAVIDRLIEHGCEVIVTTTPSRDGLASLQRDRLVLDGADLALSDEEAARNDKGEPTGRRAPFTADEQTPCVQWGTDGVDVVLEGCRHEELPSDLAFVLWLLLALQRGTGQQVASFVGEERAVEAWAFLGARYPFLGIDEGRGAFAALDVPIENLAKAYEGALDDLARAAQGLSRGVLVEQVADQLIAQGDARRAVSLVARCDGRERVAPWLVSRGWSALWGRAAAEFCDAFELVARMRIEDRPTANALMAWASAQVKDARRSLDYAKKVLAVDEVDDRARMTAILACRLQGNATVARRMAAALRAWGEERSPVESERAVAADGESGEPLETGAPAEESVVPAETGLLSARRAQSAALDVLARTSLAADRFDEALAQWCRAWERVSPPLLATGEEAEPWLLAASWVLEALAIREEAAGPALSLEDNARLDILLDFVSASLEERVAWGMPLGFGSLAAAEALERLDAFLEARRTAALVPEVVAALRRAQIEVARAREDYRAMRQRRQPRKPLGTVGPLRNRAAQTVHESWRENASKSLEAPLLSIRLFGALEVRLGDRLLPPSLFGRRKLRLLLALLALNRGRDLTRETLTTMLWPSSQPSSAAKNFYRLWSDLASVLSVEGRCPYLVRDRYGCRLDPALFATDVMEFEEITRSLLFGDAPAALGWETLYEKVTGPFAGELLPVEQENETLCAVRDRLNIEMVDSLIAASRRLRVQGEPQGALWFAREALARDETREDSYAALMEAQMAAGQRTAALDTFFTCRTYLSEALGLDPSTQLLVLYQALLEEDPSLIQRAPLNV
ncbi:BTAD domain-containing putative transcriptional regulator [uncultured Adlercreutzia sp.]|uniref:BTAD domain-containing putative transcriptional regulator n=1 Tax=uncultured Adlercreutzia sp. TaxID=875803 RepID=UPI00272E9036|nr:BTAD domain-containing putative transcriptional regulator [uncultured Adlercreutzia sp.]